MISKKTVKFLYLTSLPIMAIEGTVTNHGTGPNTMASIGLVHSKINVAATMSCIPMT